MTSEELFTKVFDKAKEFGLVAKNERKNIVDPKGNSVIRDNLFESSFKDGSAYFGFISREEDTTNQYSDFSFVVFPDNKDDVQACVVCLGVGSSGFKNDYQLASQPGLRRLFLKLKAEDNTTFFKTSFDDISSTSSDLLTEIRANYPELRTVIESYKTVLPASRIVEFSEDEKNALDVIYTWLATYAKMRSWGTVAQKRSINDQLSKIPSPQLPDEEQEIKDLLEKRRFVVLQGAPGTGKTYNALKISEDYDKTFFEQFHAETNYSDFVFGLEPEIEEENDHLKFKRKEGVLYQALDYAE